MVHLVCVQHEFHARVIAARLGSDGIFTEARPPLGGPYPLPGEVHLYVAEDEAQLARALLNADEHQSSASSDAGWADAGAVDLGEAATSPFLGSYARIVLAVLVLSSVLVLALSRGV